MLRCITAITFSAALLAACGGGNGSGGKAFSDSSALASALGCSGSFVSEQRFATYNSGHCDYNGHRTYLVACGKRSECEQIANNVDALAGQTGSATANDNSQWLIGPDWVISVQAQDLEPAQALLGGTQFITTTPT